MRGWRGAYGAGLLLLGAWGVVACKTQEQNSRSEMASSRPVEASQGKTSPDDKEKSTAQTTAKPDDPTAQKKPTDGSLRAAQQKKSRKAEWTLQPYLEASQTEEIRRFLVQGNCDAAAERLPKPPLSEALQRATSLALGRCFFKKKEWSRAREIFTPLREKEQTLQDYVDFWIGSTWFEEKDLAKATEAFLRIPPASKMYFMARYKAAEVLLEQKEAARVLSILEGDAMEKQATAWWLRARAHWMLAKARHRREAIAFLRRLLVEKPLSWQSQIAEGWIARNNIPIRLNDAERIDRAERINKAFQYNTALQALADLRLAPTAPRKLRCRLYATRGFSWFRLRKYSQAIPTLTRAASLCQGITPEEPLTLYRLGDAHRRAGRVSPAIRTMQRLAQRYPKHNLADDAVFMVAELLERSKQEQAAQKNYARLLRDFPDGDMTLIARWRLAYQAYRAERWADAQHAFAALVQSKQSGSYRPAALYFGARSCQKAANQLHDPKAKGLYTQLVKEHPLHYYSFLAVERLAQLRKQPWSVPELPIAKLLQDSPFTNDLIVHKHQSLGSPPPPLPWGGRWSTQPTPDTLRQAFAQQPLPAFTQHPAYQKGVELYRLDMDDLAAAEWMRLLNCDHFPPPKPKPQGWLCAKHPDPGSDFLALHFHLAGQYTLADRFYRRRGIVAGRLPFDEKHLPTWYLAYPLAFWDDVQSAAKKEKIDPALIYGVMREESTFNPYIQSFANAYGLMQLILPTAQQVGRRVFPRRKISPTDLYQPRTNIALGTRYLRMLLHQFNQQAHVAIPGYNAGPLWVKRWLQRSPDLPFDEWVEAISIKETRRYARYVLQSYAIYRFLYGHLMQPARPMLPIQPWRIPAHIVKPTKPTKE